MKVIFQISLQKIAIKVRKNVKTSWRKRKKSCAISDHNNAPFRCQLVRKVEKRINKTTRRKKIIRKEKKNRKIVETGKVFGKALGERQMEWQREEERSKERRKMESSES